jgi:C4-dicarboxylate transporter, DctM subunit
MTVALIAFVFLATILLGVPLVWAILMTAVAPILVFHLTYPLEAVFLNYIGGIQPFQYVAIPLFVTAGHVMSRGGMGRRVVAFARHLLGFMPGGLGMAAVAACMVFGGISGSALADSAAVGSIMIPSLAERGYPRSFAAALVAAAGTIGIIVPPSIPLIIYGFVSNTSIAELFLAGILPGVVFALALMLVCAWKGRTTGCDPGGEVASLRVLGRSFIDCLPALMMPVIILGSIFSGAFTPTEAAGLAVVYGLVVACVLYRELPWRDLPELVLDSFITSATVIVVIGATAALAWIIAAEQVPVELAQLVKAYASERWEFLLLLNIVLLILGHVVEPVPAILLSVPLFLPAARQFGIDSVHLGVIICCNLALGLFTPPIGATLFVATKIANLSMFAILRDLVPLFLAALAVLLLVTYVPAVSMTIVWAFR